MRRIRRPDTIGRLRIGFAGLVGLLVAVPAVPAVPAGAGSDDTSRAASAPLPVQLAVALDAALGDEATLAVVRGYDRGYEALQLIEGALEGALEPDGAITDGGAGVVPFRAPTGLIDAQTTANVEDGVAKTAKRLDRLVDLAERAERWDVTDDAFVSLVTMVLIIQGYSPEQIIVDGMMGGGIRFEGTLADVTDITIVDENGKRIRPEGVEESPEAQEAAPDFDRFADAILDTVAGLDPRLAPTEPISDGKDADVTIEFVDADGDKAVIEALGTIGTPRARSLDGFLVGRATGEIVITGDCNGDPFRVSGPVALGMSGPAESKSAPVKVAITEVELSGNTSSRCFGDADLVEDILRSTDFGPVDVVLRRGEPANGLHATEVSIIDSAGTLELTIADT